MVHVSDVEDEDDAYEPPSDEEEDEQSHIGRFNGRGEPEPSQAGRSSAQARKPSTPIRKSTGKFPSGLPSGDHPQYARVRQVSIDPKSSQSARSPRVHTKH
ncbi:hypothetical protein PAXRUDRAFT_271197 [Paxillus rubicundulus Ve08.2h10]|uniref:Unplaced genomic scaffold scaffold_14, whole genome shotgun sequence n=1 Tax=Paxillus rubicundulus Ve08.2h10 TaxID=930991 RepID=A0A0D0ED17_9AGAM|nr:hypothetical protein PAXRUDRAFT_271197 [Paxillus rubicundulus Ve08.2h10]